MDREGGRLLTYSSNAYGKCRLPPVHKYSSLRSTAHRGAAGGCALHALRRQYSSEGSMSSFKRSAVTISKMKSLLSVLSDYSRY